MVYIPPVDKAEDGSSAGPVAPATILEPNSMRPGAYIEQTQKTAIWVLLYISCWILMRLSCAIGLPDDCVLPSTGLEVTTHLVVLCVFAVGQAWLCEIMETRRFRNIFQKFTFPVCLIGSGLLVSSLSLESSFHSKEEGDLSDFQVAMFIVGLVISAFFIALHYLDAWRVLPGAHMISGVGVPRVEIQEDLLSVYLVSRTIILAYIIIYIAFSIARDDGWGFQHYLLAYTLSLFAQFKSRVSRAWLGITTGVFLQGFGAYGLNFLCNYRVHNNAVEDK